jgi:hypothetical protein
MKRAEITKINSLNSAKLYREETHIYQIIQIIKFHPYNKIYPYKKL